ncbi:DUF2948 family protein [Rhodoblastus acidophilus]|uniref:DUF2948 family protein n=1 Tax=Candidatus Rhodoblastus alkanivorans TaxID=2954117 RepID=A0ABS9ZA54_9HYPH|nr:DUF2948 family protein [Candidatus Rhodoblastus alkanivorans]MCI4677216.1 DUF2948 family protein [Candidatus Rhodoblastus alkanivorans]MCI4684569.1 DUF2948 family protein [Candidatus Rhodoblastus alkanivorans]MDI4641890.1 DUF2948 family protein [Rhodoblastus acidophilus]
MTQRRDDEPPGGRDLRLMARDADDLAVLAAHLQDAILRVGDMLYQPRERRFVLVLKRFDWLASASGAPQRALTGLHFENVRRVSLRGFRQDRPDDLLYLLNIEFIAGEPPSGQARLVFSGDCAVKLDVECLEVRMADLGTRWRVRHAPGHGGKDKSGA